MADEKNDKTTDAIFLNTAIIGMKPFTEAPPCLVLVVGPAAYVGRQWNIDKTIMTLGRQAGSDICLEDGGLSKSHARLNQDPAGVSLTDLGATNKTLVNGRALTPNEPYLLKNNDQIRAGSLVFKFLHKGILSETAEKERMQAELESARKVQASILPSQTEIRYGPLRIAGRSRSASETGGDWWWHWRCGDRAFVIVGDVTGHGAGAALMTSAARSAIAVMEDDPAVEIGKVYSTLSHALEKCGDGKVTMSAFLAEVDLPTGRILHVNASHLPALILPLKDEGAKIAFAGGESSPALGAPAAEGLIGETQSLPGMRLLLFTDGLTERANSKGDAMSERAFVKMVFEAHSRHYGDQDAFLNSLLEKSDDFAKGAALADDLTVVAMDF